MKKIIIIILIFFSVFIIYKTNEKNLIDYMSIGDSLNLGINSYGNNIYGYNDYVKTYLENDNLLHKYNNHFSKINYKIEDLNKDIINNKEILYDGKVFNLKKELREADLVSISIGMDTLVSILNSNKCCDESKKQLDYIINNMDDLIKNVKSFSKGKIILIGYYNPTSKYDKNIERMFAYLNDKYESISKKYNIIYIDIYNLIKQNKDYLPNKLDYHVTSKAHLKIASEIIEKFKF